MDVTISGNNGDDSTGALSNGNQIEDQQMPISPFSTGQAGLCSDILNQYGQLIGEYSRLDDELWFCKPDDIDDDAMPRTDERLESNLISSYEYIVQQERLSKPIENPVSDGGTPCVKETSSSLKDFSLDQSQTLSPVSVLHRRSYSTVRKKAAKRLRGENGRFLKCNSHESLQSMGPRFAAAEQSQSIQPESCMESSLFDETTKPGPAKQPRTKKVSDLLQSSGGGDSQVNQTGTPASCLGQRLDQSGSWEGEQDPNPKSSTNRKQPRTAVKKCMHCESTKTPQWREGPTGHGTLCNACGVQYRHGRLFPEYRPLKSPTFNPDLHSNIKPDAKRKQPKMAIKKCMHCESTKTSKWREGPMGEGTLCNACGVQDTHERLSSDYHPLNSPTVNSCLDSSPKPLPKKQPKKAVKKAVQKCMHCESTKTPQWREGPMGQGTLCNACGVQYRYGRLFPEYRPLKSPTYNPSLHSHLPKKVQQMRMNKNTTESAVSADSKQ
ncbi:hypothetical protein Cgig2_030344 [Carnegiea gigantea]|uniref:GATA-type domain-containing protein n=1 Tax=Carnegiea gigantea TaxID=171969 RepID=A0A9Q1KKL2_9CARY|nr:hypothetical protein Cgig2_030344 [Carnegiea gigantea]